MCCWTAVCWNRTGYMELCCVFVLTEGALVQGRMGERSEDVLLDSCLLEQDRIYGVKVCVCVLTEGVLGQWRMGEWGEDVLLDSCLLEQDRIYGVMFCMCIDRGCVGTGENGGV